MPRRLLVVERVISRVAGELVLAPSVDAGEAQADPIPVEVRRLDGSAFRAMAKVHLPLRPGRPKPSHVLLRLLGVREHVPGGTEIWTLD